VCLNTADIRAHRPAALAACDDYLDLMLYGGDDYELLAAINPRVYRYTATRFRSLFRRELWVAGRFERGDGSVWIEDGGKRQPHTPRGYDHLGAT
jgi:thiamine monophosphate kinase